MVAASDYEGRYTCESYAVTVMSLSMTKHTPMHTHTHTHTHTHAHTHRSTNKFRDDIPGQMALKHWSTHRDHWPGECVPNQH